VSLFSLVLPRIHLFLVSCCARPTCADAPLFQSPPQAPRANSLAHLSHAPELCTSPCAYQIRVPTPLCYLVKHSSCVQLAPITATTKTLIDSRTVLTRRVSVLLHVDRTSPRRAAGRRNLYQPVVARPHRRGQRERQTVSLRAVTMRRSCAQTPKLGRAGPPVGACACSVRAARLIQSSMDRADRRTTGHWEAYSRKST